jgi:lysozyme
MGRRVNAEALALVKRWEGLRLTAYLCPAGVWTIGYGSTGPHVREGMTITEAQADALLVQDLARFEAAVSRLVTVPLTDGQFGALVSLAFNIGIGAFGKSTLLRKLNAGDYTGAQEQFHVWRRAGGKVLPGLVNRRAAEAALFGRGEYVSSNTVEPDEPPSQRVTNAAQVGGGSAAAIGTTAAALNEQAGAIAGVSSSPAITMIALILTLAGVGLLVWSLIRRSRE